MKEKILGYSSEMEDRVAQRTKKLETQNEDLDKTKVAMLNILEDVQNEKITNEKQKRRLQVVLESLPVGVFIAEPINGVPEFINKEGKKLLGKGVNKEASKDNYQEFYGLVKEDGSPYPEEELPLTMTLNTKEPAVKDDIFIDREDGNLISILAASSPVTDSDGNLISVIVVFQDKTKEYKIDRAKTEFVSLASHQLRTPLSAINWYTEMLLSGDAGEINDEQEKYLREVETGSARMVSLVNSLLNVSRLELGTFSVEPEETDVVQLLRSVLDEVKPQADEKNQTIVHDFTSSLPKINLDPKLFRIVMQNFVSNAVKYTPEDGEVKVSLKEDNGKLLFSVKGNGMGIPEEQKNDIYKKLFRADNVKATDTEGTGLGLYIVRQIVEHSGGRTWFDSVENEGTTFYAEVPMSGMIKKEGTKGLS